MKTGNRTLAGVMFVKLRMLLLGIFLVLPLTGVSTAETEYAAVALLEGGGAGSSGGSLGSGSAAPLVPEGGGEKDGSEQGDNGPDGALQGGGQLHPEQNGAACGGRALYDACFLRVSGQWLQGQCLWQQGNLVCVLSGSGGESSGGRVQ
ncbi:hypothetical protein LN040_07000 [Desulfovibrio subterraneus]|uniref:hypothetical protein n=1 Tax=Desulfovibrio subterraneus TaxID=2718620 RepID=UPI0022B93D20|nr:hypothetical protein [Desulfovibrio subterraneus]WBF68835.1 hypothetical protein LN040_07000 [Desulfovibrio subterraneus]